MSELPKVYENKKSNKSVRNEEIFYSSPRKEDFLLNRDDNTNKLVNSLLIKKKINDIFNSPNFVYKVKVKLNLKDEGVKEAVLIAKTNDTLLTMENESIPIKDILEIYEI